MRLYLISPNLNVMTSQIEVYQDLEMKRYDHDVSDDERLEFVRTDLSRWGIGVRASDRQILRRIRGIRGIIDADMNVGMGILKQSQLIGSIELEGMQVAWVSGHLSSWTVSLINSCIEKGEYSFFFISKCTFGKCTHASAALTKLSSLVCSDKMNKWETGFVRNVTFVDDVKRPLCRRHQKRAIGDMLTPHARYMLNLLRADRTNVLNYKVDSVGPMMVDSGPYR